MEDGSRHMALLALELGERLDALKECGVTWYHADAGGMDPQGEKHFGAIVVKKGEAVMVLMMRDTDRIDLCAQGIGLTRGVKSYPRQRVTSEFVMRAVKRFMART